MSLLADLLSKKNNAKPTGGRDIPPTLIRSHGMPDTLGTFNKRYIVISAVSVVTIAVGVFAMTQLGPISSISAKKPVLVQQPVKPPEATAPVPSPAPATAPAAIAPVAAVAPVEAADSTDTPDSAHNEKTTPAKQVRRKSLSRIVTKRRLEAIRPAKWAANSKSSAPAEPLLEAPKSVALDAAKRDSLLYSARSAEQAGNWNAALTFYRKAQKIDPENYKINSNAAAALNNLGMFEEGAKEARLALGKKPDYVPAMINAAIAYSSTGNSQDALQLFSKASSADPSNRSLAINLGIMQERIGKFEDAQKTYRRLADDSDPLALNGIGRVYERTGNKIEAIRAYRQLMALPNANTALKKEVKEKLMRLEE